MQRNSSVILPIMGIVCALLAVVLMPQLTAANGKNSDVLTQVLGGTADLAADAAYREADLYFHAGVGGGCHHAEGDHCAEENASVSHTDQLPLMHVMEYLDGETSPRKHKHIEGKEEKELLPWFIAAVRLNPHLIEAWRTGTYWFYRTGSPKRALAFISKGIESNPNSCLLYLERGMLKSRLKMWKSAVSDLTQAQQLWKNDWPDADYDARAIATYLKAAKSHL